MDNKRRYCIIYIRDTEHQKLINVLEKYIPKERGEVFYPRMEYYRRGEKAIKIRPIFQGYVFLYTDLNMKEVHELLTEHRKEINAGTRELMLSEYRTADKDFLSNESEEDMILELSDVDDKEEEFLDYLRQGDGLLVMSSGYQEDKKKYVVMEGPLKAYESKIKDVDKHNRKAFLEFEINGRRAQAGFNCLPKAHYFPEKDSEIVSLQDGTEVDLNDLKKKVMNLQ